MLSSRLNLLGLAAIVTGQNTPMSIEDFVSIPKSDWKHDPERVIKAEMKRLKRRQKRIENGKNNTKNDLHVFAEFILNSKDVPYALRKRAQEVLRESNTSPPPFCI